MLQTMHGFIHIDATTNAYKKAYSNFLDTVYFGVPSFQCTYRVTVLDLTLKFLEESFKGGRANYFIKVFLFARQNYMDNLDDYRSWYSSLFGSNSNFKTTVNATLFKFVVKVLISLIPYEPKRFLKIHISMGIAAPPKCNSLIFDYKNLCRSRLEELKQSPTIMMNGTKVTVLHLIEDCARNNKIKPMMINIIDNQYEQFYNTILPQVLRNKIPFTKVKQLLLNQQYITNNSISFCRVDPDGIIFDVETKIHL